MWTHIWGGKTHTYPGYWRLVILSYVHYSRVSVLIQCSVYWGRTIVWTRFLRTTYFILRSDPLGYTVPWHTSGVVDSLRRVYMGRSSVPGVRISVFFYLRQLLEWPDPSSKEGVSLVILLLRRVGFGTNVERLWNSSPKSIRHGHEVRVSLSFYYLHTTKFGKLHTIKHCVVIFCLSRTMPIPSSRYYWVFLSKDFFHYGLDLEFPTYP